MRLPEREAFLDGYRHGLGAGIRSIETVIQTLGQLRVLTDADREVVRSVLTGLNIGLRHMSASVVLANPKDEDDE